MSAKDAEPVAAVESAQGVEPTAQDGPVAQDGSAKQDEPVAENGSAQPQEPAAPGNTAAPASPEITAALANALYGFKDRLFVLSLEQELQSFIHSPAESHVIRPLNSYYRLLAHQLSEYYGLGHNLINDSNTILVTKEDDFDATSLPASFNTLLAMNPHLVEAHQAQQMSQHRPNAHHAHAHASTSYIPSSYYGQQFQFQAPPPPPPPQFMGQQYPVYSPPQQHQQLQINPNYYPTMPHSSHIPVIPVPLPQQFSPGAEGAYAEPPTKDEARAAAASFKIMKREDNGSNGTNSEPSGSESKPAPATVGSAETSAAEDDTIETERASRQSLYQEARERIFDNGNEGEDDDEEDADKQEEEEDDDDYNNSSYSGGNGTGPYRGYGDLRYPPNIPLQQQQPYLPQQTFIPQQYPFPMAQGSPYMYSMYQAGNGGVIPNGLSGPNGRQFSPNGNPYYQPAPYSKKKYHGHGSYHSGGVRKRSEADQAAEDVAKLQISEKE